MVVDKAPDSLRSHIRGLFLIAEKGCDLGETQADVVASQADSLVQCLRSDAEHLIVIHRLGEKMHIRAGAVFQSEDRVRPHEARLVFLHHFIVPALGMIIVVFGAKHVHVVGKVRLPFIDQGFDTHAVRPEFTDEQGITG